MTLPPMRGVRYPYLILKLFLNSSNPAGPLNPQHKNVHRHRIGGRSGERVGLHFQGRQSPSVRRCVLNDFRIIDLDKRGSLRLDAPLRDIRQPCVSALYCGRCRARIPSGRIKGSRTRSAARKEEQQSQQGLAAFFSQAHTRVDSVSPSLHRASKSFNALIVSRTLSSSVKCSGL